MNSNCKIIRRPSVCLLLACGGFAAAAPMRNLPRPEDPVVLPTDEEVFRHITNVRESELKSLKWDKDGWDDLWVMIQNAHDKNFQFDPNDKQRDTDGDGMSDYEEMLVHRDATRKEPIYTKEEQIARVREERRKALVNAKHVGEQERKRRDELAPLIIPPLTTTNGRPASAAEVDEEKLPKLAALAKKNAVETEAADRRAAIFAQRHGIAKHSISPEGQVRSLIDVVDGVPEFNVTSNAVAADSISTDEVRPGGTLGLNLTGGGRIRNFTAVTNNGAGRIRLSVANATDYTVGQAVEITGSNVLAYNGTWNVLAVAAATVDVDRVFSLPATGGAITAPAAERISVGVWDGGDVLTGHQEFTPGWNRINDRDGVSTLGITGHATHVSGTIAARGVTAAARGMANNSNIDAYDWIQDLVEMPTAAGTNNLRLSNHSYGPIRGWATATIQGVNQLAWYGNTTISQTEDYRFGFYDTKTRDIDVICYDAPNYLPIWAAGNERNDVGPATQPVGHWANQGDATWVWVSANPGTVRQLDGGATGFDSIAREAVAKNVLTIGAVADLAGGWTGAAGVAISDFGSFGGCDDGRIKPDLSANGVVLTSTWNTGTASYNTQSGTSMAAPSVAGSAALLREHYTNLFGLGSQFRAATLKCLLIHTSDEAGGFPGPDYRFGWGLMNTRAAAALLTAQQASGAALRHVKQMVLQNTDFIQFQVRALGAMPLKVTIAWSDPPGTVPARALDVDTDGTRALVNDLDLRLFTGTTELFPWRLNPAIPANGATRLADNNRDNVEQVQVDTPPAGAVYTIRVNHKGTLINDTNTTTPQAVSMAISGITADAAPAFRIHDISATGTNELTITWRSVVGATYRLQTSTALSSGTWTELAGDFVATKDFTSAEVANTTGEIRRFWRIKRLP